MTRDCVTGYKVVETISNFMTTRCCATFETKDGENGTNAVRPIGSIAALGQRSFIRLKLLRGQQLEKKGRAQR